MFYGEIEIVIIDLPESVDAVTIPNNDGYVVYLNKKLFFPCSAKILEVIKHEMRHISLGHFERKIDVREAEWETN